MRRNRKIYLRMNLIDLFVCIKERMLLNIEWDEGKQDGGGEIMMKQIPCISSKQE